MMSVITALFDEFETLRSKRTIVISSLVFCLTASSVYFCTQVGMELTNYWKYWLILKFVFQLGFSQLTQLPNLAVFTHVFISGVLLLMTTWVYGRVRFQCDLQFMLGKTISSFKIFFIRFVTPIFLGLCLVSSGLEWKVTRIEFYNIFL